MDFFDNRVYFFINKPIDNEDDIEMLNLYFQAGKYGHSCGEIIESKYYRQINTLEMNFVKNATKQEILLHRFFKFKSYELQAFEIKPPSQHEHFVRIKNMLIFENIDRNSSVEDIEIYINCLVRNNEIKSIEFSTMNENVVYVTFKEDILDFQEILLSMIPTFKKRLIVVYEAYNTNIMLLKTSSTVMKNYISCINKDFVIKNECYCQVAFDYHNSPFIVIKFRTMAIKQQFIEGFLQSELSDVFLENLLNIDLLNNYYLNAWIKSRCNGDVCVKDDSLPVPEDASLNNSHSTRDDLNGVKRKRSDHHQMAAKKSEFLKIETLNKLERPRIFPKKCDYCPYVAHQNKSYFRHLKGHKDFESPHRCTKCSYNCKNKLSLYNHAKIHN